MSSLAAKGGLTAPLLVGWVLVHSWLTPSPMGAQERSEPSGPIAGASSNTDGATLADAQTLIGRGEYRPAIDLLEGLRQEAPASSTVSVDRLLTATLNRIGEYDRTIELLSSRLEQPEAPIAELGLPLGLALAARGEDRRAEAVFRAVRGGGGPDSLIATVELGELLLRRADRAEAEELFYSLITAYNQRSRLSPAELTAVGRACEHLGRNDPQLFKDALKAYDEAIAADPNDLEPRLRLAELFVGKYDSQKARASAATAVQLFPNDPRTLLAMARVEHFDGSPKSLPTVEKSLEINPRLVEARVFLAGLRLELEQHDVAEQETRVALETNPRSLEALSTLAAAQYLRSDEEGFAATRERIREQNPKYAGLFVQLAESCVQNRLYRQARDFAAEGVEVDPKSWAAWGELGLNQLRIGEIEPGRASLEKAFAGDPYNVWNKNTLDLLDTYGDYRVSKHGRFELFIHRDEADALAPYIGSLAEEAYQSLADRYRHQPPTPIRIEVYPSHQDFSVRTVGLAGLGALGVSFGRVVAIDSPSAREVGHFNWGSTLWHELAHSFTLGVTEHRVPRWLTEGLSVLEERRARPGWGDDVRPEFLQALRDGMLLGLAEINNGFVRPTFPIQIGLSYYQASLLCELIEREHGFDSILKILEGYRQGKDTEQIWHEVLDTDIATFDAKFFGYLEERFAGALPAFAASDASRKGSSEAEGEEEGEPGKGDSDDEIEIALGEETNSSPLVQGRSDAQLERAAKAKPEDFRTQLAWGARLLELERYEQAIPYLERGKDLFPEFVGGGNAYRMLAKARRETGDLAGAATELELMVAHNETAYQDHRELADLLAELGRDEERASILDRSLFIYPFDPEVHVELAEVYRRLERHRERARELAAVVALDPPSRAEALYQLAAALVDAGDRQGARREVLRALELAPSYDRAQKLLLDLIAEGSS